MRGSFVISLDFEQYWGVRDNRTIAQYERNLRGAREVIPRMLELFDAHSVHATWATVGFLWFERKGELLSALPEIRPTYANTRYSPYEQVDKVGSDECRDPFHFGASLIRRIAATPGQELATHTFSHYYSLAAGQNQLQFAADLDAAVAAAARFGVSLRSIVFPRNEVNVEYLDMCHDRGLRAFRGTQAAWMYRARSASADTSIRRGARLLDAYLPMSRRHSVASPRTFHGMVDVSASRFLRPRSARLPALEQLKVRRVLKELEVAASRREMYHLWWHPDNFGVHQDRHLEQLVRILQRFAELRARYDMQSHTMLEAAENITGCA